MTRGERLALVQGLYFVVSGIWPVVHLRSFELVTGAKKEDWLVRTVGLFVTAIGTALLWSAARRDVDEHTRRIGALGAIAPALIDSYEGGRGRIRRIYLVDAIIEWLFAALWTRTRVPPALHQASVTRGVGVRRDEFVEVS